jgi:16S rRNA (cytidine1402-2'-O)-methyltransferase
MIEQKSFIENNYEYGTLYLVPTPIGNMSDFSPRAIEILSEVDIIAAEDTRHSGLLTSKFEIKTRLTSLHEHNYASKIPQLIGQLKDGKNIAQISDAGTPSISDPGHELVLEAIKENIKVVSIPGPMAGVTALIASGLLVQPFTFIGFLSKKKAEQEKQLQPFIESGATLILYESPYRIIDTLENLQSFYGDDLKVAAAREITKKFETYIRGTVLELINFFKENEPKGEFVLMIESLPKTEVVISNDEALKEVESLILSGTKSTQAIKEVAKKYNLNRNKLFDSYNNK